MALFNYATKEITIKIVYYGPGLSGKTTNLQHLHSIFDPSKRGKLLSLATEADRTLFFDFLPVEMGKISDFSIRIQLYTVPGQVRYNATRKLVLKGADAVVFVADSQREMKEQNIESLKNMRENLIANNINPDDTPLVLQYNKRDLTNISSAEEMTKDLNRDGKYEYREAVAIDGTGVEDTFHFITKLVMKGIAERHNVKIQPSAEIVEAVTEQKVHKRVPPPEPPAEMEIERSNYEAREVMKEPLTAAREVTSTLGKRAVKEIAEVREPAVIPAERLDLIVEKITGVSESLKEVKKAVSNIQSEINDMKKEQKAISSQLRDITNTLVKIKTKRKWFSFS
jgi:signal recognition particle receptor subunit beta